MEREIGKIFKIRCDGESVFLKPTETKENECKGCYFESNNGHGDCTKYPSIGECHHITRVDGKGVIFKTSKQTKGKE